MATNLQSFQDFLVEMLGQMYIWGGHGEEMTPSKIRSMEHDTGGTHLQDALDFYYTLLATGKKPILGFDCSGLISRWLYNNGLVEKKRNCNHLAAMCTTVEPQRRSSATDLRLKPGDLLFRWSSKRKYYHVGVYVGDNEVVEAKGRTSGVVQRTINANNTNYWTHWGRLPYFEEIIEPVKFEVTSPYKRGEPYLLMQQALVSSGYGKLDVDGIWGPRSQAVYEAMLLKHVPPRQPPISALVTVEIDGVTYRGDAIKAR